MVRNQRAEAVARRGAVYPPPLWALWHWPVVGWERSGSSLAALRHLACFAECWPAGPSADLGAVEPLALGLQLEQKLGKMLPTLWRRQTLPILLSLSWPSFSNPSLRTYRVRLAAWRRSICRLQLAHMGSLPTLHPRHPSCGLRDSASGWRTEEVVQEEEGVPEGQADQVQEEQMAWLIRR